MIDARKFLLVGSAILLGALAAIGASWARLEDARSRSLAATDKLAECQRLADEIKQLRGGAIATAGEPARELELTRQIAQAVSDAGLPASSLDRIEHDAPRHSATGAYLEKPTRILIRGITLRQFITLLHALDRPADGLRIDRLHLTAPQDATDSKTWTAEAMLLHTVAEPRNGAKDATGPDTSD